MVLIFLISICFKYVSIEDQAVYVTKEIEDQLKKIHVTANCSKGFANSFIEMTKYRCVNVAVEYSDINSNCIAFEYSNPSKLF